MMLRFHVQTGGSTLTAQQPLNNIARVTLQALSAVLGGTQSLHTNGYDEALTLPTEEAAGIALRTQQVLAYESGAADTTDPLGGSYFVESLTNSLEEEALRYIAEIDRRGGAVAAIEAGYLQDEIARASYTYQEAVQSGERIIVGVNRFIVEEPPFDKHLVIDDSIRQVQVEALRKMKAQRNDAKVAERIAAIESTAKSTGNLMPVFIEAVENEVTLGEISDALRRVFGEYK
jgi:methylmalonyl-CoA mutase N-terminal domain/subunit